MQHPVLHLVLTNRKWTHRETIILLYTIKVYAHKTNQQLHLFQPLHVDRFNYTHALPGMYSNWRVETSFEGLVLLLFQMKCVSPPTIRPSTHIYFSSDICMHRICVRTQIHSRKLCFEILHGVWRQFENICIYNSNKLYVSNIYGAFHAKSTKKSFDKS